MEKNNNNIEEEIDFKAVAKNPIRWFGIIYPFFFGVIILLGFFYIDNLRTLEDNDVPAMIQPLMVSELTAKKGTIQAGVIVEEISKPNDELVQKGMELFTANCASCHGEEGKGDGTAGAAMNPKPRNFTNPDNWVNGRKISDMYKTLEEGIIKNGMAAYEYLPVADRFAIIHYVRTFADDFPIDTDEDLQTLDMTYSLSQGKQTSNQIPVAKAMAILEKENLEVNIKAEALNNFIMNENSESAKLLLSLISCPSKAVETLLKADYNNGTEIFANEIINGSPVNGFKPSVAILSAGEWENLKTLVSKTLRAGTNETSSSDKG